MKKSMKRFGGYLGIIVILVLMGTGFQNFDLTGSHRPKKIHRPINRISVEGNRILLNGIDRRIKGIIFTAFSEESARMQNCRYRNTVCERNLSAQDFYYGRGKYRGQSALDISADFGANVIRLNISQEFLDLASPHYSQDYVREVVQATNFARRRGFGVIVALFAGTSANLPSSFSSRNSPLPLNDESTLRAARTLARRFGKDQGVMIELLNEPWSPGFRREGWEMWLNGGYGENGEYKGKRFVGANQIIKSVRKIGAKNVIILQGLGARFDDFPGGVIDPLNNIVYSVHPLFADGEGTRFNWQENFGNFARNHPFLITAWNSPTQQAWCKNHSFLTKPAEFLRYLRKRNIDYIAYGLDPTRSILIDFKRSTKTLSRLGERCGDPGSAGELIVSDFAD